MRALLVQQGLQDALLGEKNLLNTMQEKEKTELLEKAHSAIIHGSINLIYIHTDFLKPLLNCTNQSLHKNKKQRNYSFSPITLITYVSFFLYRKTKIDLWLWISKLSFFLALYSVQLNALLQFSQVYTFYNSQKTLNYLTILSR